jgi:PIN domain nuclease of toxin-antitoxin system
LIEVAYRFRVFPITVNIALQAYELPSSYPKDPADRIIGATALVEDIPLLTADREIRRSRAVPTIW